MSVAGEDSTKEEPGMATVSEATRDFLAQRRIAVAGVSRTAAGHGGNVVYKRLKDRGYEVFAVNPNTDTVDGDPCFRSLDAIPGGVDAVVIATNPANSAAVVADCERLGISRVWMHRSFGAGQRVARGGHGRSRGRDDGHRGRLPAHVRAHGRCGPQVHEVGDRVHQGRADRRLTRHIATPRGTQQRPGTGAGALRVGASEG